MIGNSSRDRARTALIVGGGGAIGSATARLLLDDGYKVALTGRSSDSLAARRHEISDDERVSCHAFDAADWAGTQRAVAEVHQQLGEIDVVVNAAGIFGDPSSVESLSEAEFRQTLDGNLMTVASVTCAVVPYLRRTRGCIANVAATDGFAANPGYAAEGATKAAVIAFSQHSAVDLGHYGIRVNAVAPGWVDTPMSEAALVELGFHGRSDLESPPLGRIGTALEIAEVIRFVCSPAASYMTGSTVVVDGGLLTLMADVRTAAN